MRRRFPFAAGAAFVWMLFSALFLAWSFAIGDINDGVGWCANVVLTVLWIAACLNLSLFRGRLQIYIEPRDIWVGVYIAENEVYVCPLPLVVFRWERSESWAAGSTATYGPDFCAECGGPCRDESDYDDEVEVPR